MPLSTSTYAIDNLADYPVTAHSYCDRILVQENYDSAHPPTDDLTQKGTAAVSTAVRIPKGTPAVYTQPGGYSPTEIAGYIRAANGSVTVQQIESKKI